MGVCDWNPMPTSLQPGPPYGNTGSFERGLSAYWKCVVST